jgi:hypothetical protein
VASELREALTVRANIKNICWAPSPQTERGDSIILLKLYATPAMEDTAGSTDATLVAPTLV